MIEEQKVNVKNAENVHCNGGFMVDLWRWFLYITKMFSYLYSVYIYPISKMLEVYHESVSPDFAYLAFIRPCLGCLSMRADWFRHRPPHKTKETSKTVTRGADPWQQTIRLPRQVLFLDQALLTSRIDARKKTPHIGFSPIILTPYLLLINKYYIRWL